MSQFYYREDELQKMNKRYTGDKGYIIGSCKYRNEKIACWVCVEKYVHHKLLQEMMAERKGVDGFILR